MTGFEPANNGATIHCRNLLATPAINIKFFQLNTSIIFFYN